MSKIVLIVALVDMAVQTYKDDPVNYTMYIAIFTFVAAWHLVSLNRKVVESD